MDIPEDLRHLVDELGEALVRALVEDPRCHELTQRLQASGFDLALSLEVMVVSHSHSRDAHGVHAAHATQAAQAAQGADAAEKALIGFSRDDEALLRTFRIALD